MTKIRKNAPHKENMKVQRATNKKRMSLLGLIVMVMCVISLGIFTQSCSRYDEPDTLDSNIVNSTEMEEYIIAASDFKRTLSDFEKEISKVDFSKLEVAFDTDGRKIMRVPAFVRDLKIDEKLRSFNQKKEALQGKYPQIVSFTKETNTKYVQQCIRSSLKVKNKLLKMGIDINQPKLKVSVIESFNNSNEYCAYLASWVSSADYVEIVLVIFKDGSAKAYSDPRNTERMCKSPGFSKSNGEWHVNGDLEQRPIEYVTHTHTNSAVPSPADSTARKQYPDLTFTVYYDGVMNYY
jgi:hypothetical protein